MSIMAMVLPQGEQLRIGGQERQYDRQRCVQMALVHDLAESIVGDLTPHCGVSREEKHRMEKVADTRSRRSRGC
jgi:5'-deoxynucleotidase YfbR-like HD superfamily hydrolase